jgi:benzylsuccinate CoA-transferase BbsF subunit
VAVLAALIRRGKTGEGTYIDLSQYETGVQFLTPALLDYFVNGRVPSREGNRHPVAAPHGVFRCRGQERWVALSIHDDTQWRTLVEALGRPSWVLDADFSTLEGRKAHESRLEALLSEWTGQLEREEVVARFRAAELHVYPVNSMADLFSDPQLAHRRTWVPVEHPVQGKIHAAAPPFLLKGTPPVQERSAPCLGADTQYVLGEILGLSKADIEELGNQGVLD